MEINTEEAVKYILHRIYDKEKVDKTVAIAAIRMNKE